MTLRILIVCTANVCRSPMAAALLSRHCRNLDVDAIVVSAGTDDTGLVVDALAVEVLAELGLDISPHRPRRLNRTIVETDGADLILAMTRSHLRVAATTATGAFRRTFTMREFARRAVAAEPEPGLGLHAWLTATADGRHPRDLMGDDASDDIADPYGASAEEHRRCADELDQLTNVAARTLATLTARRGPTESNAHRLDNR